MAHHLDRERDLAWPFFDERHRVLVRELDAWAGRELPAPHDADVGALRIYEGATEVQQLIIARDVLMEAGAAPV